MNKTEMILCRRDHILPLVLCQERKYVNKRYSKWWQCSKVKRFWPFSPLVRMVSHSPLLIVSITVAVVLGICTVAFNAAGTFLNARSWSTPIVVLLIGFANPPGIWIPFCKEWKCKVMMYQRDIASQCTLWAEMFNMQMLTACNWTALLHFWQINAVIQAIQRTYPGKQTTFSFLYSWNI